MVAVKLFHCRGSDCHPFWQSCQWPTMVQLLTRFGRVTFPLFILRHFPRVAFLHQQFDQLAKLAHGVGVLETRAHSLRPTGLTVYVVCPLTTVRWNSGESTSFRTLFTLVLGGPASQPAVTPRNIPLLLTLGILGGKLDRKTWPRKRRLSSVLFNDVLLSVIVPR